MTPKETHPPGRAVLDIQGPVAVLTLHNLGRMNAIDLDMATGLCDAVQTLKARDDVGALLLRGAGDAAFCAGMDIKYATATGNRDAAIARVDGHLREFMRGVRELRMPCVTLLRGVCYGAGVHLAVMTDFRLCATDVRFSVPAIRNRLVYPIDAIQRLRLLAGTQATWRILMQGAVHDAATLHTWGLADELHEPASIDQAALQFCVQMAAQPRDMAADYVDILRLLDRGDVASASDARETARSRLARATP